ncbi:MAG: hypothetical protein P0107_04970 [Nitrosomonas sp.]|nr:hypothetical protein [Nitrosomonas sp.]
MSDSTSALSGRRVDWLLLRQLFRMIANAQHSNLSQRFIALLDCRMVFLASYALARLLQGQRRT